MFAFIVVITSLVLAFSPFQLHSEVITLCTEPDKNGVMTCYQKHVTP